jgi:hypothetical protein
MKSIPRAVIYNFSAIVVFFIIYLIMRNHFTILNSDKKATTLDLLNLSITMQTSVGNPYLSPKTSVSKFMITLQQFLLIFGNLFILHI